MKKCIFLGCAQALNAIFLGNISHFVKIKKGVEAIMEQKRTHAAYFALHVADNNQLDFGKIIYGDRGVPALSKESIKSQWQRNLVRKSLHAADACFYDRVNYFIIFSSAQKYYSMGCISFLKIIKLGAWRMIMDT